MKKKYPRKSSRAVVPCTHQLTGSNPRTMSSNFPENKKRDRIYHYQYF